MVKSTVTVYSPEGVDPFSNLTSRPAKTKVLAFLQLLRAVILGGILQRAGSRPSVVAGTAYATATVTCATVVNANTVTINGQALTATQHYATGTVTPTTSGIDVDDTVSINGYDFTAKATENTALGHFKADGTDAQCCTSLAACINASTNVLISGIVTATATSTVVTVRAVTPGTGGNAITLASSDAQLAVSAATLAGGAAIGNNEFDFTGTDAQDGTSLATAINASTTAIVANHVKASNLAGTVACSSVAAGDTVTVAGVTLRAVAAASAGTLDTFANITSDTATGAALAATINAHPVLKEMVLASASSGTVTVRQLPVGNGATVALSLTSSNNTRLAVTAIAATAVVLLASSKKGTGGNQATLASSGSTVAVSAARLAGGTDSTLTF